MQRRIVLNRNLRLSKMCKEKFKIAILYIATGRYTVFWESFYRSAEKFLLPCSEKSYFIFTDNQQDFKKQKNIFVFQQEKLGWPYDTLMRFEIFLSIKNILKEYDFIYFFNGNTEFLQVISEEDLLPLEKSENLVLAHQPHMFHLNKKKFTYDRNPKSLAYIPYNLGKNYFTGALNGGKSEYFLEMCEVLNQNICSDLKNKIIAIYHDESHLNKYALNRKDIKVLNPYFSKGELEYWKKDAKLMFADKTHYRFGGHQYLRGESNQKITREEWEKKMDESRKDTNLEHSNISSLFVYNSYKSDFFKKCHDKPWRYFYFGLVPKILRNKLAYYYDIELQNKVAQSWETLISYYEKKELEHFNIKPKKNFLNNKIIWQYWAQGFNSEQLPDIVKICRASVEKHKADYQVILLDDKNIDEYLELPTFIQEKRKNSNFKHAFFADLIRLGLLTTYGGVWLDATILMTGPLPQYLTKEGFFMYQRVNIPINVQKKWQKLNATYFNWNNSHRINVLNSIIFAEKYNAEIKLCFDLLLNFWKTQNRIPHYFFFQIMFDVLIKTNRINMQKVDDTLPHLLLLVMKSSFNMKKYQEAIECTSLHKMTYFKKNLNIERYYTFLIENNRKF